MGFHSRCVVVKAVQAQPYAFGLDAVKAFNGWACFCEAVIVMERLDIYCDEAPGRAISLRAVEGVAEVEEPRERGGAPRRRGRLAVRGLRQPRIAPSARRPSVVDQRDHHGDHHGDRHNDAEHDCSDEKDALGHKCHRAPERGRSAARSP